MTRKRSSPDVTIFDVANEAGVSYSTVSRVVNNKSYVKEETRRKVLKAMDDLGYQANLQARSLAGGRSNVIGLLVVDLATQYVGELVRGIDEVLAANQFELMLYTTHRRKIKESTFVTMMARGMSDGLLIVLPRDPETYLGSLRQHEFPYVLIDQLGNEDIDLSITADNFHGAYTAINHLLELGHRRIGLITGWMDMISARHRLDGYRAALADYGIPFDQELVFEGNFSTMCGRDGARHLLDLHQPPTAIFASNDDSALGVIETVRIRGLHVPDDISVVGFDDIPMASIINPRLTTVKQPLEEMGRRAATILLDSIEEPEKEQASVVFPAELIIRESASKPYKMRHV
ncbi:MAG: LacI family DNA-binding transcriptional regulator [Candidatus Promineifilaceae bacterium]|jgi:LacI family transcriptional regulator